MHYFRDLVSFQSSLPRMAVGTIESIVATFPPASTSGNCLPRLVLAVRQQRARVLAQFFTISFSSFCRLHFPCIVDPFVNTVRFPRLYSFC